MRVDFFFLYLLYLLNLIYLRNFLSLRRYPMGRGTQSQTRQMTDQERANIDALNQQFFGQQQQIGNTLLPQYQNILNNPGLSPADIALKCSGLPPFFSPPKFQRASRILGWPAEKRDQAHALPNQSLLLILRPCKSTSIRKAI